MQQNTTQANETSKMFSLAIDAFEKLKQMSETHDLEFQDVPQLTTYETADGQKRLLCTARFYVGSSALSSPEDGKLFRKV